MGISDFFRKVRTLLEGDQSPDEVYTDNVKSERVRPDAASRPSDSAARLAERMAGEYVDPNAPDVDDDNLYEQNDRFYRAPVSYSDDSDDAYGAADAFDDDLDDDYGEESTYTAPAPAREENAAPAAAPAAQAERFPTRTEVTLRQIERLSKKLDAETLREYQMRLIKLKQDTGAVSALTALRILHEYVDDDPPADDDTRIYPDLSAK